MVSTGFGVGGGNCVPVRAGKGGATGRHATDGWLPQWTAWWDDADVAPMFPDAQVRRVVSAEQPRLPLSYYEELVPVPVCWDSRPCGYLLFGPPYDAMAQQAAQRGWLVDEVPGLHLHQLMDPDAVTRSIIAMTRAWRSSVS